MTGRRARIVVLLADHIRDLVLRPSALDRLRKAADIEYADPVAPVPDIRACLADADVCVTGWGSPKLDSATFDEAPRLRLVAHTAGSIRKVLDDDLVERRVRVTHAAAVIADSVGEFVIGQIIAGLRGIADMDRRLRAGEQWVTVERSTTGRLLGACTVGVVGASRTGQAVIRLLRAFGAEILVSDPVATAERITALGAEPVKLDELLERSDIVTLHAPLSPATVGLLGRDELARLRDGALVINSARGSLIDGGALREELVAGRLKAALDVFEPEPLPDDSAWLSVPGTILTTHNAGHTREGHLAQGDAIVDEILRFLDGAPLQYEITASMARGMA